LDEYWPDLIDHLRPRFGRKRRFRAFCCGFGDYLRGAMSKCEESSLKGLWAVAWRSVVYLPMMLVIIAVPACEPAQTRDLRIMRALGRAAVASEKADGSLSISDAIAHLDDQTKQWLESEKRKGSLEFPSVHPEQLHGSPSNVPIAILRRKSFWIVVYGDGRAERMKPTEDLDLVGRDTRLAWNQANRL
jgi:hypothetical protein